MNRKYADIILSRILSLCELRGITINKLADMSGIRQSTLHNLVCGASVNPTMRTMHKIAIAFNMTLAEFLDFPDLNNYSFDDDEEEDAKNSPRLDAGTILYYPHVRISLKKGNVNKGNHW